MCSIGSKQKELQVWDYTWLYKSHWDHGDVVGQIKWLKQCSDWMQALWEGQKRVVRWGLEFPCTWQRNEDARNSALGWVRSHMRAYGSGLVSKTTWATFLWLFATEPWRHTTQGFLQKSGRSFTFAGLGPHGRLTNSVTARGMTQQGLSNPGGFWSTLMITSCHRWSGSQWWGVLCWTSYLWTGNNWCGM